MAAIFPLNMTKNAIKTLFFKILLRYFQNSNGKFSGSMVVIRKKYWVKKFTSGLVVKIQNGCRKPVFRQ